MKALTIGDERFELIEDAAALIFPFYADAPQLNAVKETLVRYSSELLCALVTCFRSNDGHVDTIKTSVTKGLPEGTVWDHLEFFPLMEHYSHRFRSSMVKSLRLYYPDLSDTEGLTSMGPVGIKQCKTFIEVALTIEDVSAFHSESCARGLKDQKLVDLIKTHTGASEYLLKVIIDRNTTDPDLIESVLCSHAPAVSDGVL